MLITLRNATLVMELAPFIGGSIARCYSEQDAHRHHWLRPASDTALAQQQVEGMACFPMLPHCGRIRQGQLPMPDGRVWPLPHPQQHSLHGIGWRLPWQMVSQIGQEATITLSVNEPDWPVAFQAEQIITLTGQGFVHQLTLTHQGKQPYCYGMGLHPYFNRSDATRLRARTQGYWQTDAEVLPVTPHDHPLLSSLLAGGLNPACHVLDNTFYGWDGVVSIEGDRQITISTRAEGQCLAIYTPVGQPWCCVEPCSHVPDYPARGEGESGGGVILQSGEQFALTWHFVFADLK